MLLDVLFGIIVSLVALLIIGLTPRTSGIAKLVFRINKGIKKLFKK
jgi:hypothetical protein